MEQHRLREWENQCIQEEAPWCQAACPLHIDARGFIRAASQGRWAEARKILEKTLPFAGILGRICDHPCERQCKRREAGDPVAIGTLERAVVTPRRIPAQGQAPAQPGQAGCGGRRGASAV